ncbi:Slp1p [Sporobolomyces salmoneus]|uniref:Slp1p n=1 Tax=Sporobolomyces salmoneus TaxID=183962 RepID=UPI00317D8BBC
MRLVRTCYCLFLCVATTLASSSLEESPSSTELSHPVETGSTPTTNTIEAPSGSTILPSTPIQSSIPSIEVEKGEETASEGNSSILATSTSPEPVPVVSTSSKVTEIIVPTPSEAPPSPSSPPPSESSPLSSTPSPSVSIPPLPSISIVSEVPLTSIPSVPEFLSFNEWKEKYVVVPDPSIALARRARKAAQRQRQDVIGSETVGDKGASYDGDGADLGSLFASGEESGAESSTGTANQAEAGRKEERRSKNEPREDSTRQNGGGGEPSSTNSLSPIQPLPNVGTGDENDPLVPLKDRSNYAAFECAAMVHRSSRKTKGASAILVEKKDRYMLTPCSADPKFVEVELCDEIQIDTIVLANFEFFSSMFKHFKASCSVNYPGNADDWHDLGTFRARNIRGVQVFRPNLIPNFCRYIRINFLSHFGSEYYCPVSLLRVYGYTQLDAYRESERKARQLQEALAAADEFVEDEVEEFEGEQSVRQEEEAPSRVIEIVREEPKVAEPLAGENVTREEKREPGTSEVNTTRVDNEEDVERTVTSTHPTLLRPTTDTISLEPSGSSTTLTTSSVPGASSTKDASRLTATPSAHPVDLPAGSQTPSASTSSTHLEHEAHPSSSSIIESSAASSMTTPSSNPTSSSLPVDSSTVIAHASESTTPIISSSATSRPAAPSDLPIVDSRPLPSRNNTPPAQPYAPPHRAPVISPPIQQPQPGESIYATIMKRLTSLEHNQTLSMHFIEAQSSMLREAFTRIERRLSEVEATRSRQEQGIRQTLLDLEKERKDLERERLGLTTQVGVLAQEIRLEKRLNAIQLVGTLLLIVFVGFTRSIPTSPFLHLASSAQSQRRGHVKEGAEDKEDQQASNEEKSSPDLGRKPLGRRLSGTGAAKHPHGHSKRYPSMSKPGPRRHYGTGTSSSARSPAFVKSPRAWTPPLRHSSAPPEEPPLASTSSALETKEARRRRGSTRRPGSPFEFPRRSKLDTELGLAIESMLPQQTTTASPASFSNPLPPFLDPTSRQISTADEADMERSMLGDSMTNGDLDHYTTTDDDEDGDLPPSVVEPALSQATSIRPPNPTLRSRPSTSMGIPFPEKRSSPKRDSDFTRRSPNRHDAPEPPSPPSTLPSPPPELTLASEIPPLAK